MSDPLDYQAYGGNINAYYGGNPKSNPRTMVWKGSTGDKPNPFTYCHDFVTWNGSSWEPTGDQDCDNKVWSPNPAGGLLYDDNGNQKYTPNVPKSEGLGWSGHGWPVQMTFDEPFTVLVHNYQGKLCAIYLAQADVGWVKQSGNISIGMQKSVEFAAGVTFRVDFVG